MEKKIQAEIVKDVYRGNAGWVTDYHVSLIGSGFFEDVIKEFDGKKVEITIREIKEIIE